MSQFPEGTGNEKITSFSKTGVIPGFMLRYVYHINIVYNFGFFVGTTTGILMDPGNYGNLYLRYGIALPTILGGLSLNLGQSFRLLGGAEYGAIWYPEMTITTDSGTTKVLGAVPDMFAIFGGVDYFFSRNRAFSFQVGWRHQKKTPLNDGSSGTYLNTLTIASDAYYAQMGLTFQIGDIYDAITSVIPTKK